MGTIVFTGGGTSGHVTPNLALIPMFIKEGYHVSYIGSYEGIEKNLVKAMDIEYFAINSGKLRRYLDFKNITDIFRIIHGFFGALLILRKLKPRVVFSKGGFVSTPVIWAAKLLGIPSVIHESDITVGLANKLSIPFARRICYAFPETGKTLPKDKSILTGIPLRREIFAGDKSSGLKKCGFTGEKPVLMVMGGSQGSKRLNDIVEQAVEKILETFDICHICGKGNLRDGLVGRTGYMAFEYVTEELPDLFAAADIFLSRAGATSLFEILQLKKPNILVPLSEKASRGDQVLNALSFEKMGFSHVIGEEDLTCARLVESLNNVYGNKELYVGNMEKHVIQDANSKVYEVIKSVHK